MSLLDDLSHLTVIDITLCLRASSIVYAHIHNSCICFILTMMARGFEEFILVAVSLTAYRMMNLCSFFVLPFLFTKKKV